MMLTLSVFYSIPEFDVSTLFLLSCGSGVNGNLGNGGNLPTIRPASGTGNPERIHLQASGGTRYSQQINESESVGGAAVSVKSWDDLFWFDCKTIIQMHYNSITYYVYSRWIGFRPGE